MQIDPTILSGCWLLTGPTASGKTAVALELADLLYADELGRLQREESALFDEMMLEDADEKDPGGEHGSPPSEAM